MAARCRFLRALRLRHFLGAVVFGRRPDVAGTHPGLPQRFSRHLFRGGRARHLSRPLCRGEIPPLVALFFAFWLFSQSYFVIQVLCPWCLLITLTTTLVFAGLTRINVRDGVIPAPQGLRRAVAQGLDWALWGLIIFGVVAMVVAKYGVKLLG